MARHWQVTRLLEQELLHELTVDTHSMRHSSVEQSRLFVHVDLTFDHLPCSVLAIDGRDVRAPCVRTSRQRRLLADCGIARAYNPQPAVLAYGMAGGGRV